MTMVNDATEAALGLLGLTGSIDFSTTPTIPLKRKPPSTTSTRFSLPTTKDNDKPTSTTTNSDSINCICGYTYDDGFSIACDDCSRWVHAACFDIIEGEVPDEWRCWVCQPRRVDRERAGRIQRMRQKTMQEEAETEKHKRRVSSPGVERKRRASAAAIDGGTNTKRKRRYSVTQLAPSFDRQASTSQQHPPPATQQHQRHQSPVVEDEHIDIDEPAMHSYVHIDQDIIPHEHTRDKLKRLAQHWRGMTALDTSPSLDDPSVPVLLTPDEFPSTPQTTLHPLSKSSYSHPTLSSHVNSSVRPPSYTVRTTQPIPSSSLIAPYTSTIIPSTVYLSDPLNSYAHLGMPKPFVHLMGPPLDLALDARLAGNGSRYVRSGCRPNAVLRPMLCRRSHKGSTNGCPSDDTLSFGVFALRDLKAHEEVVLGWEWDDGSVIHQLPALIDSPQLFAPLRFQQFRYQMTSMLHALTSTFTTCACGAKTRDCALSRLAEFIDGQTPPTPSPSPPTHHADGPMGHSDSQSEDERRRGSHVDLGPLVGVERGFRTRERVPMSGGMSGVEMVTDSKPRTNGWGQEVFPEAGPSRLPEVREPLPKPVSKTWDRKGKGRATDDEAEAEEGACITKEKNGKTARKGSARKNGAVKATSSISPSLSSTAASSSPPIPHPIRVGEDKLPPKFRKKWIRKTQSETAEHSPTPIVSPHAIRGKSNDLDHDVRSDASTPTPLLHNGVNGDAEKLYSPHSPASPNVPLSTPPLRPHDPTSPSASFANLSLLSPLIDGPPACPPASVLPSTSTTAKPETSDEDATMHDDSVLPVAAPPPPPRSGSPSPQPAQSPPPAISPTEEIEMANQDEEAPPEPQPEHSPPPPADEPPVRASTPKADEQSDQPIMLKKRMDWDDIPPPEPPAGEPHDPAPEPERDPGSAAPADLPAPHVEEAPPPKVVKLSLKDFALRKKKQREEENKANASPVVPSASLGSSVAGASSEDLARASPQVEAPAETSPTVPPVVEESKPEVVDHIDDHVPKLRVLPGTPEPPPQELRAPSPPPDVLEGRVDANGRPALSFGAKVEMADTRIPSPPPPHWTDSRRSPSPAPISRPPPPHINSENVEPSSSALHSPPPHQPLARTISREDGEIFSPPPPKPTPLAPRAYSPPTRPRSFHPPGSTSPLRPPPPPPPRRPLQPAHRSQAQNGPLGARPLPSGPRALRGLGGSGSGHHYGPFGGGGPAPRAPSADRDRDHRLDWERDRPTRGSWRGRGWGR